MAKLYYKFGAMGSSKTANALMKLNGYIDVLIPRGGAGLIKAVT
mgnify:CR=1 FL=1